VSELLDYGRAGRTLALPDFIDMHAHFGDWSWHIPDTTAASLVAVMDRVGVRSMICSHMQCMGADCARGNREVLAAMRAFPGRILGYLIVWPWSDAVVKAEVARCLEAGFVGAKLHDLSDSPTRTAATRRSMRPPRAAPPNSFPHFRSGPPVRPRSAKSRGATPTPAFSWPISAR
jgi:hypothetical protein